MSIATATIPLVLIAGKDFEREWDVASSETGAAESLTGIGAVEFRMRREGLPATDTVIWSLATGEIEIVDDEMRLSVPGSVTGGIAPGRWRWLLSYGETEAETPLAQGVLQVTEEP
jgi:hypothetical protein